MNNKPVAWINYLEHSDVYDLNVSGRGIPLYTHPVKEQDESFDRTASHMAGEYVSYQKELTDEEIANTWDDVRKDATLKPSMKDMQDFARAILRKASEKC